MKIIPSVETCLELRQAGFDFPCWFTWIEPIEGHWLFKAEYKVPKERNYACIPAPTLQEIIDRLTPEAKEAITKDELMSAEACAKYWIETTPQNRRKTRQEAPGFDLSKREGVLHGEATESDLKEVIG